MTYQTTNDFDLTRQDGTYTGATGELVVSDGGTITLPTPTAGEKFGVRALRNDVTLLSNGSIEASTSDRRIDSEGNSVFVSDGTEWYLVSGNEYFGFDIPDGAIHRYQFESDVTDSIGGSNGTNNGGSFVNNSIEGAEAIEFESANNDNVDITTISPSGFSDDAWSVSAWVNFNSLSDFARIVAGSDIQSGSTAWGLFLNNDTSQKLSVVTYNGTFTSAESSVSPTLGQWYHLVGTYDGSSLKLYVDGAEEASLTTAEGTISEDVAHIGSDNDTAYMNGLVDDVILFNRPLPSTDVSQLYSIY